MSPYLLGAANLHQVSSRNDTMYFQFNVNWLSNILKSVQYTFIARTVFNIANKRPISLQNIEYVANEPQMAETVYLM